MSPVRYELRFYILDDGILYSHCRENLKSYNPYHINNNCVALQVQVFGNDSNKSEFNSGGS
jgi:hypothetical protein